MHIILNSLRYALWLVFCLFRHAVFVPAAFGGVCLLAWLVFGHPVSDLNDQLQKARRNFRGRLVAFHWISGSTNMRGQLVGKKVCGFICVTDVLSAMTDAVQKMYWK